MASTTLSPQQSEALLDILVHHETYSEVERFKDPEAIEQYGFPFDTAAEKANGDASKMSSSPLLQLLLTRLVLPMPGVRDLSSEFWNDKFRNIMRRLSEADLSESYDKGTLGSRKRLASAASVIHECITRGLLSGIPNDKLPDLHAKYDIHVAQDLARAWDDVARHMVYGNLMDELFDQFAETANIEDHSPAVEAAVHFAIIFIATFLHHLFVLSAEGPYLLKLLDNVHSLVPYSVIGQTLRVGNAGTMINGLVRLFLAKLSVGAISNWLGLTQNADDGMNLMQRIISLVLEWDTSEFRKAIEGIRRSKDGPGESHLAAIDEHVQASREQHESIRESSKEEKKSIIIAILENKDKQLTESLSEAQHTQCLEYYSAQIAIRDREKITEALCRQTPDLATSIVRDGIAVFEPMIRAIHKNVDLRKHIGAVESFLTDLIKTSKPKEGGSGQGQGKTVPPSIEDYVSLLKKHRRPGYDYIHDFAQGCPDLRTTWLDWAKNSLKFFRQSTGSNGSLSVDEKDSSSHCPEEMDKRLQDLFNGLPEEEKSTIRASIDAHVKYLSVLENISDTRVQSIIDAVDNQEKETRGSMSGPGVYITRWHSLLDETIITPITPRGPPRKGRDVKGLKALGKTEAVAKSDTWDSGAMAEQEEQELQTQPEAPDVSVVIEALGPKFKSLVAGMSIKDLPLR
ncbi:PX-associated-domain-containing protein [Hypoxylon sp. NC1633]|nr:PX-associated-domain-containing protein [Hypoxylon sp. NC1633]